jgi:acetylglutamate kinase
MNSETGDLGLVGEITDVDTTLLRLLLKGDFVPVVAPTALGDNGEILNVNADFAASAIARALHADLLLYMSDVDGVYVGGQLVESLASSIAEALLSGDTFSSGMIPKIESALNAVKHGVDSVRIVDGRKPHCVVDALLDQTSGTSIVHAELRELAAA